MGVHVPWSLEPIWRGSAAGLTATLWMERIGLGAAVSRASFGAGLEGLKAIEKVGTGPWARLHNTGAHATRPDPSSASRRARFRSPRPPLRVSRRDPLFQGVGLFSRRERAGARAPKGFPRRRIRVGDALGVESRHHHSHDDRESTVRVSGECGRAPRRSSATFPSTFPSSNFRHSLLTVEG